MERFPHTLWLLLVFGIMVEACSEATFGGIASSSGTADQTSVDADAIRLATERLQAHLQSLPVAKGKVAPFVETRGNEMKVVVSVGIAVVSVLNINDAQQTMMSSISIDLRWHDKALSWNTSDYDGVGVVEMSVDSIWVPHVYITNSLDDIISEKRVTCFAGKQSLKTRNLFIEERKQLILMFVGGGK